MKKILVISDTHGNQKLLKEVLTREDKTHLFHLGDEHDDIDGWEHLLEGVEISKVPGIFNTDYLYNRLPKVVTVNIEGWSFTLVHNIDDLPEVTAKTDIVLSGHTHIQKFVKSEGVYFINPGHLKKNIDRTKKASYLIMEVTQREIKALFKDYEGKIITEKIISRY